MCGRLQFLVPERIGAVSYTHLDVYKRQHSHYMIYCEIEKLQNVKYTFLLEYKLKSDSKQFVYYGLDINVTR